MVPQPNIETFTITPEEYKTKYGMIETNEMDTYFPIAVVGIGFRGPGANSVEEFEKFMDNEECAIAPIPEDRWDFEDFYSPQKGETGFYTITKLGFCKKYYLFDPDYFNISHRESMFMDAQQRSTLETTDEALQDAGITSETLPKNTGVFVGMGIIDFPGTLVENRNFFQGQTLPGLAHTVAANRISHYYGLSGPSCAVDTACAASLTALHCGCMALWNKECELSIAGATSHLMSPETTIAFSHLGVLSATGHSAPFDESNNGYVRAEGTGICVMKPLHEAIRDGDHIYCAIRATLSAHNGYSMSLTMPSSPGQEKLIRNCYEKFGVPLDIVDFVEAHGTSTPVGDPLETVALGNTFGAARKEPLPVASAKSNFGHLEVAAGMVQVVKAAIMLDQRKFFKQIKWNKPNPRIDFEKLNLRVQLKNEKFTKDKNMIIGVNTFGFGGSLVHMIFEEVKKQNPKSNEHKAGWNIGTRDGKKGRRIAIPLSAKCIPALKDTARQWLELESDIDAFAVSGWQATRREHYDKRIVIIADSADELDTSLKAYIDGDARENIIEGNVSKASQKTCFVFSGWGQQWFDMGRSLYKNEPIFKTSVDKCDQIFKTITGNSALTKYGIFTELDANNKFDPASIDQAACKPGILFWQIAMVDLLKEWNIKSDFVLGVGLGEVSAAYASGAMSREACIKSMCLRMKAPPKEEFLAEMKKIVNGPMPSTSEFYSTITGKQFTDTLSAQYWWDNVASKPDVTKTVKTILEKEPSTTFVEIAASDVLSEQISQIDGRTVSFGKKDSDDFEGAMKVMASLHCAGYKINWNSVTRNAREFTRLPLYPYQHQWYQLETREYRGRRTAVEDKSFVGKNGIVDKDKHNHMRDYILDEETVFPASAYIEYLTELDTNELSCLRDIAFKGKAVVPEIEADGYINDIKFTTEQQNAQLSILTDGEIKATGTTGTSTITDTPLKLDIADIKKRCTNHTKPKTVYNKFEELGLTYGLRMKILEDVFIGDGEVLSSVIECRNRYERIQTALIESAFQTGLAAFSTGSYLYLPDTIKRVQMYTQKIPLYTKLYIHTKLKHWSSSQIVFDATICNDQGDILIEMEGINACSTCAEHSEVDLKSCLYTKEWQSAKASLPRPSDCAGSVEQAEDCDIKTELDTLNSLALAAATTALSSTSGKENTQDYRQYLQNLTSASASPVSDSEDNEFEQAIEANLPKALEDILNDPEKNSKLIGLQNQYSHNAALVKLQYTTLAAVAKFATEEALKTKKVVKICKLGDASATGLKSVTASLGNYVKTGHVQITSIATDEKAQKEEKNSEYPTLQYSSLDLSLDINDMEIQRNTFDIVIANSLTVNACTLAGIGHELLLKGGLFISSAPKQSAFTDILTGKVNHTSTLLSESLLNNGFDNIYANSTAQFEIALGEKTTVRKNDDGNMENIIVYSDQSQALTAALQAKLIGAAIRHEEFAEYINKVESTDKRTNILYLATGESYPVESKTILANIEAIREHENASNLRFSYITESNMPRPVGSSIFRSFINESKYDIYTIEIESGQSNDKMAESILSCYEKASPFDREMKMNNSTLMVPRVSRYDASQNITPGQDPGSNKNANADAIDIDIKSTSTENGLSAYAGIVRNGNEEYETGAAVIAIGTGAVNNQFTTTTNINAAPKPMATSWSQATHSALTYTSAYKAVIVEGQLQAGQTLLVSDPNTCVGNAAVQLGKQSGAKILTLLPQTEGSGAVTLDASSPSFESEVNAFTQGMGIDMVIYSSITESLPQSLEDVISYSTKMCSMDGNFTQFNVSKTIAIQVDDTITQYLPIIARLMEEGELRPLTTIDGDETTEESQTEMSKKFSKDGTYIITGGYGRIGQQLAIWLAKNGAGHIAVTTRANTSTCFRRSVRKNITNHGSQVYDVIADISTKDGAKSIFTQINKLKLPAIKGIFNLAGNTENITENTFEALQSMANVQVQGLRFLIDEIQSIKSQLECFVLMTSATNLCNNSKLSTFGAINNFIDYLASEAAGHGIPALALQCGPIRGVGALNDDRELMQELAEMGMKSLHINEVLEVLGNLLTRTELPTVVSVANQDWSLAQEHSYPHCQLFEHLVETEESDDDDSGLSFMETVELKFRDYLGGLLGTTGDGLDLTIPVTNFGVDSLMSTDIINWSANYGVTIEQGDVFGGLTMAMLFAKIEAVN